MCTIYRYILTNSDMRLQEFVPKVPYLHINLVPAICRRDSGLRVLFVVK